MIRRRRSVALVAAVLAAAAIVVLAAAASARSRAWTLSPVAAGLDSPRGLAVSADGTLLVAEAGHGGDVCVPSALGPHCIGLTSQVSRIDPASGAHRPVVTGLYSRAVQLEGITGVDGLSAQGGRLLGAITSYPQELDGWSCGGQPADCATVLAASRAQAGRLIQFTPAGTWKSLAGVGGDDFTWTQANPSYSTSPPNANPYGVVGVAGGAFVADAGSNTLDYVAADGAVAVASALAPPAAGGFPADTVPTCVTVMRGNLYAGSLSGRLWKRSGSFTPVELAVDDAGGHGLLHHVTGCASDDRSGSIYLVDMWGTPGPPAPVGPQSAAGTGSVVELAPNGTATVLAAGLDFPNGIAVAGDGSLYVSVASTCTAVGTPFPYCAQGGRVVRLQRP